MTRLFLFGLIQLIDFWKNLYYNRLKGEKGDTSMSKTNYEEQLFNSIDLIVEKRIANLDYDKTIICTITDNSNKHNNKYSVSDGSTIFIA
jgi:hypothetical protein